MFLLDPLFVAQLLSYLTSPYHYCNADMHCVGSCVCVHVCVCVSSQEVVEILSAMGALVQGNLKLLPLGLVARSIQVSVRNTHTHTHTHTLT